MKTNDITIPKITQGLSAKHFRNLDSKIRKKWNKLYQYRKGRNRSFQENNGYSFKIYSDQINYSFNSSINPHSIQQLRAERNRLATQQRYKKNNDIFYKKKNSGQKQEQLKKEFASSQTSFKQAKRLEMIVIKKKPQVKKQIQGQNKSVPYMLQRRKKKLQKSIQIIDHLSQLSLNEIQTKQNRIFDRHYTQQRKLIDKMKGTKVYYSFIREWKSPASQDSI